MGAYWQLEMGGIVKSQSQSPHWLIQVQSDSSHGSHGSHAPELELTTLVPLPALEVRVIVEDHEQTWRSLAVTVMVLRLGPGAPEEAAL